MDTAIFLALVGFVTAATVTPGPNNMMLLASGANFGLRRTVPHMLGIAIGCGVMVLLTGAGLVRLFDVWPPLRTGLTVASVAYLLYLAWKIATAAPSEGEAGGRPLTFLQAAAFQWVNPKAWFMVVTALTVHLGERSALGVAIVAAVFVIVALPSVAIWAAAGQQMRRLLTNPSRLRAFNWTMAALLVASLWPVLHA